MLDRLGICLLHRHYDIRANEVLVETTDRRQRASTVRPVEASSISESDLLETMWKVEPDGKAIALQYCARCGRDKSSS